MENVKLLENMETQVVGEDDTSLLKNHNIRVYYDLKKELLENKHVLLETCPGSGKSYVTCQLIKNMCWNALIIVPTNAIQEQWNDLRIEYNLNMDIWTYQKFSKTTDNIQDIIDTYDTFVLDEAHHILADTWCINLNCIKSAEDKYILGLTADSIRWSDGCIDVCEEFFGNNRVYGYSLDEVYDLRLAEPFRYVCGVYNKVELKKSLTNNFKGRVDDLLIGKLCATIDNVDNIASILSKYSTELPMMKIVVFVETYDDLKDAQQYLTQLNCNIYTVYNKFGKTANVKTITNFKNDSERCAIFCIDMLSEGVHISGVDTVIMLRRTFVPNMYIQMIGRIVSIGAKSGAAVFDFVSNHINIANTYQFTFGDGASMTTRVKTLSTQILIDDYLADVTEVLLNIYSLLDSNDWLEWEDNILYENYEAHGAFYCAGLLNNRTAQAVRARASKLGISYHNRNILWTDEMVNTLKVEYEKGTKLTDISDMLGLTVNIIRSKIDELELGLRLHRLSENERVIIEYLSKNTDMPFASMGELLSLLPYNVENGIKRSGQTCGDIGRDLRNEEVDTTFDALGRWTQKKIKILIEVAQYYTVPQMKEIFFPEFAKKTISDACKTLGLSCLNRSVREDVRVTGLSPTNESGLLILRKLSKQYTLPEIRSMFFPSFSVGYITSVCHKNGISFNHEWDDNKINMLRELSKHYTAKQINDIFFQDTSVTTIRNIYVGKII